MSACAWSGGDRQPTGVSGLGSAAAPFPGSGCAMCWVCLEPSLASACLGPASTALFQLRLGSRAQGSSYWGNSAPPSFCSWAKSDPSLSAANRAHLCPDQTPLQLGALVRGSCFVSSARVSFLMICSFLSLPRAGILPSCLPGTPLRELSICLLGTDFIGIEPSRLLGVLVTRLCLCAVTPPV